MLLILIRTTITAEPEAVRRVACIREYFLSCFGLGLQAESLRLDITKIPE